LSSLDGSPDDVIHMAVTLLSVIIIIIDSDINIRININVNISRYIQSLTDLIHYN